MQILTLIDQYLGELHDAREFHCDRCRQDGYCNEEVVPVDELELTGPPCCPDCAEVMTPGPYTDPDLETDSAIVAEAKRQRWQRGMDFGSPLTGGGEILQRLTALNDCTDASAAAFMLAKPVGGRCLLGDDAYYRVR